MHGDLGYSTSRKKEPPCITDLQWFMRPGEYPGTQICRVVSTAVIHDLLRQMALFSTDR